MRPSYLCSLMWLGCATPVAQNQADAAAQTRAIVDEMVHTGEVPAISYVQATTDAIVLSTQRGRADVIASRAVTASTMYMACSTTKIVTAIAVLQLAERDRLKLDAPVSRYFDGHPYGDTVTVRMLLAHTGGIPNPIPKDWFFVEGDAIDREAALQRTLAANAEPAADPGTEYGYSNIGYWLLEKVIEAASGQSYVTYVRAHVLEPLGLDDDTLTFELPPADRLARGHGRRWSFLNGALYVMAPSRYWLEARDGWSRFARVESHGLAFGGAYTTAHAFAAILRDLLRDESVLLGKAAKADMFARQEAPAGEPLDGTLGWVLGELDGVAYLGKQGGGLGFHGNIRIYPSIGLATVFFANSTEVSPGPIDGRSDTLDAPMVRWKAHAAAAMPP